ncbi:MAG: hypothetical protein ABSG36_12415 [Acidimicrobiales bacterium]|jgi:hypothetical protein
MDDGALLFARLAQLCPQALVRLHEEDHNCGADWRSDRDRLVDADSKVLFRPFTYRRCAVAVAKAQSVVCTYLRGEHSFG